MKSGFSQQKKAELFMPFRFNGSCVTISKTVFQGQSLLSIHLICWLQSKSKNTEILVLYYLYYFIMC